MRLVKLSEDDYRPYQRLIRSLKHSVNPREHSVVDKNSVDSIIKANRESLLPKQAFKNSMMDSNVEAYFLREDDKDENLGVVYSIFKEGEQYHIIDFGILSEFEGKGIGTAFFNKLLDEVIRPKQCKIVTLQCPFPGAQLFWKKMGFEYVIDKNYYSGNPTMKKRI